MRAADTISTNTSLRQSPLYTTIERLKKKKGEGGMFILCYTTYTDSPQCLGLFLGRGGFEETTESLWGVEGCVQGIVQRSGILS